MSQRTVMFIDGENILLRYEAMIDGGGKPHGMNQHSKGRWIWNERLQHIHQIMPYRIIYYTAACGDDAALENLQNEIAELYFSVPTLPGKSERGYVNPRVFKKGKTSAKTKSVDINLTADVLRAAHNGSVDRVMVLSGDGDYLPVYEEVMRMGIRVTVGALSSGLNRMIPSRVDYFWCVDDIFFYK